MSQLSVLARTFEKLIAKQLTTYCDAQDVIPPQQFGFRKASSYESALVCATKSWLQAIDKGSYVGALLIDLSKAFDTIPHQRLLSELQDIGVSMDALVWFTSFLVSRYQHVVQPTRSINTELKSITRGVPQGSGLSPLVFNIFVRNMPACCNHRHNSIC